MQIWTTVGFLCAGFLGGFCNALNLVSEPLVLAKSSLRSSSTFEKLISLESVQGEALFVKMLAEGNAQYALSLLSNLETQVNLGACAAASAVTVLNSLKFELPYDPNYAFFGPGFPFWTQQAYSFDQCVKSVVGPHVFGQSLQNFGRILSCVGLQVECVHGGGSESSFETKLIAHVQHRDRIVVANFDRQHLNQSPGGGHFSPIAGLVDDRFLILDVARYKYPPVFAHRHDLIKAMSSFDDTSQANRGFCAVWKP